MAEVINIRHYYLGACEQDFIYMSYQANIYLQFGLLWLNVLETSGSLLTCESD